MVDGSRSNKDIWDAHKGSNSNKRGHIVMLPAFQLDAYDSSSVIGKESFAPTTIIFLFFKD